ncbi:MAG: polyribonucleotide nucleotidyltransferase, partial [Planctomycetia bacterium]|nr:polyribonucleotide nucleotidyltransferase [Planctomycetia bacterium]
MEKQIGSGIISFETGTLAKQAGGSCLVRYNDTVVLCAATTGAPRPGIDFFPLTCDYRERTAAAGKFPGGFIKREGRPTTKETLTARLLDRPIRPLFPEWFRDEVQVQAITLSSDRQTDADVLAMNGASACLCLSPMPFEGPVGAVRIGYVDGKFIPFPTQDELEGSELDLIVSGTATAVAMIEGFAREMPEDLMMEAILEAHRIVKVLCQMQIELCQQAGAEKKKYEIPPSDGLREKLEERYYNEFKTVKQTTGKHARADAVSALKKRALSEMIPDPAAPGAFNTGAFGGAWHALEEKVVRDLILAGTRADG